MSATMNDHQRIRRLENHLRRLDRNSEERLRMTDIADALRRKTRLEDRMDRLCHTQHARQRGRSVNPAANQAFCAQPDSASDSSELNDKKAHSKTSFLASVLIAGICAALAWPETKETASTSLRPWGPDLIKLAFTYLILILAWVQAKLFARVGQFTHGLCNLIPDTAQGISGRAASVLFVSITNVLTLTQVARTTRVLASVMPSLPVPTIARDTILALSALVTTIFQLATFAVPPPNPILRYSIVFLLLASLVPYVTIVASMLPKISWLLGSLMAGPKE